MTLKFDLYLLKCHFKPAFNDFYPHIKAEYLLNIRLINTKKYR